MGINKLPPKTRLHTDARRPRDLSCRYAVLVSRLPRSLIFRGPGLQREATLERISLASRSRSGQAWLHSCQEPNLSISRRTAMEL